MTYKKICTYIIEFTLCGICGWIYETALTSYLWGEFAERGFLHIPVLPIYGVFAFILIPDFLISVKRHKRARIIHPADRSQRIRKDNSGIL